MQRGTEQTKKIPLHPRKPLLPREGFHADVLGSIIRQTLLNPKLTIPLLIASKYIKRFQDVAVDFPRGLLITKILAGLGILRVINSWLDRRILNNWVKDSYKWEGGKEVILITGGSDGIGKEIAIGFAKRGIAVAVLDVQPLTYVPPDCLRYYECDITSAAAISNAAARIRSELGEPTVLINNAGICRGKSILDSSAKDVSHTFEINSIAHYTLAREFVPYMVKHNHGMVVTIASSAVWVTAPRMTDYAASKAAAMAFHEGLAAELVATHNANKVRTVLVNQGYTKTKLFEGFGVDQAQFFGPALEPETLADAVIEQVLQGESGQIIIPGFYKLGVANFRGFPNWFQHRARSQLSHLMTAWKGRQVAALNMDK